MKSHLTLLFVLGVIGFFVPPAQSAQRIWDGSNDCSRGGNECPGGSVCINNKCVSSFGAEIGPAGCLCCACEACVCEKRPECCSYPGYWDYECVALCGEECGGYGLNLEAVDCEGKQCGWDGCFGSCGTCGPGLLCVDGLCEPCEADCEGKECGPDGCGGVCGMCDEWNGYACLDKLASAAERSVCVLGLSMVVPEVGCCETDTTLLTPASISINMLIETTNCGPGTICRWDSKIDQFDNMIWAYGCFPDYIHLCPADFDMADCADPETWDQRCCLESPYLEYPRACDYTQHYNCSEPVECGDDGVGGSCGACAANERCVSRMCEECARDCEGRECGEDGCGGSCGNCGAGMQCITGHCLAESGCGLVGDRGCCVGDWLVECVGGRLWARECNPFSGTALGEVWDHCVWRPSLSPFELTDPGLTIGTYEPTEARYVCGQTDESVQYFVYEDPIGEYPRECDFTPCTKDCTGKSCGDDGCGGTCGGCGDHRDCVDHQCVDRIPEPTPDVVEPVDAVDADEPDVAEPTDANDTDGTDSGDVPATDTVRDDMTPDLAGDTGHDVTRDTHTDTIPPADNITESEPSPGCGCSGSTAPAWPGSGVLFVLLLCIYTVVRARTQKR